MLFNRALPFQLSILMTAMLLSSAQAAETIITESSATETEQKTDTLPTIRLVATKQDKESVKTYTMKKSSSATGLNIKAKETPQTINTVTRQQMDDFGLNSARDVLSSIPGITVQNQETERTTFSSRGFTISNLQTDGVGMPFDSYDYQSNGNIDTYVYDRIDVIKGAAGLVSAIGSPGATVNFVRKRPTKELQANTGISYGSWDNRRVEADVSGGLFNQQWLRGRLVAATQQGNSYLDHYSTDKTIFSGSLEADITDSTLLTVGHMEQYNRSNGNNWGALPLLDSNGKQLEYDVSYNPVPDWVFWDTTTKNSFIELKQQLGANWEAKANYNYTLQQSTSKLLYYTNGPDANGGGVGLYPSIYNGKNYQQFANLSLKGTFPLFGQEHDAMLGLSWAQNKTKEYSLYTSTISGDGISAPPADAWYPAVVTNWNEWINGKYNFAEPVWDIGGEEYNKANARQEIKSASGATRIHLNDDLKLLLGVNYTKYDSEGSNYGSDSNFKDDKVLPYAGITYNITPDYTLYSSYSTIFRAQQQLGPDLNPLKPLTGLNYEVGVKAGWLDDRLTGSMAVFRTNQENFGVAIGLSPAGKTTYDAHTIRSQGYEVTLAGQLTDNVQVSTGYTQFNIKDRESGESVADYIPRSTFSLFTTYHVPVLEGLKLGAGLTWQDSMSRTDDTGTIRQSAYALLNVMASYEVNDHISLQANGNNIGNRKYLNGFPDGQGYYGAPVNYTVGIKLKY